MPLYVAASHFAASEPGATSASVGLRKEMVELPVAVFKKSHSVGQTAGTATAAAELPRANDRQSFPPGLVSTAIISGPESRTLSEVPSCCGSVSQVTFWHHWPAT